jgi:CheY-like chemotaxis protein
VKPILIVEDDADIRDALRETLEEEGYTVAVASNGHEGLGYLEGNPEPALVLLDWMMPFMNGAEFCKAVASNPTLENLAIIVITADSRADDKMQTRNVRTVLKKPLEVEDLIDAVATYAHSK